MKQLLPALLLSVLMLSGCADQPVSAPDEPEAVPSSEAEAQETEAAVYETIAPPEGGWTTEEIMSVTYLCDQRLSYPLSMEALGEDFSLSNYSKSMVKIKLTPGTLSYKGQSLANATVIKPHDEMMIYNIVILPTSCEVTEAEPFVINGVKMGASMEETIDALGEDYWYKSEDGLLYNDRETGESLYSLFFENDQLVHINVAFRFDIDLPLYQNN